MGGGVYISRGPVTGNVTPFFTNCLITGNKAFARGGGLYLQPGGSNPAIITTTLLNCTIAGNEGVTDAGSLFAENCVLNVRNSIVYNNATGYVLGTGAVFNATYSALFPFMAGIGNLNSGVTFYNAPSPYSTPQTGGNFRISDPQSPLIDGGDNTGPL